MGTDEVFQPALEFQGLRETPFLVVERVYLNVAHAGHDHCRGQLAAAQAQQLDIGRIQRRMVLDGLADDTAMCEVGIGLDALPERFRLGRAVAPMGGQVWLRTNCIHLLYSFKEKSCHY